MNERAALALADFLDAAESRMKIGLEDDLATVPAAFGDAKGIRALLITIFALVPTARAAKAAAMAWLPALMAQMPRARSASVSDSAFTRAPRALKLPVC
jgi:hypothetical protein